MCNSDSLISWQRLASASPEGPERAEAALAEAALADRRAGGHGDVHTAGERGAAERRRMMEVGVEKGSARTPTPFPTPDSLIKL